MVPEINLLPKIERQKSNSILVMIISGVLLLAILLLFSIQYMSLKKEVTALTEKETYVIAEKADLMEQVNQLHTLDQGTLTESVLFAEIVSYPVSPILIEIDSLLEERTYLRRYDFMEQSVNVVVDFETMTAISIFIEKLLQSDYFSDVKIEQISNFEPFSTSEDSSEVQFDVIPRYSATIHLMIDEVFLRAGGDRP